MSDWETLLNKVKVGSSPNTYLTVKYRYQRIGADMLYDVYVKGELQSSGSYRNDSHGLDIRLDNGTTTSGTYKDRYYNSTWKPSGSGHWPVSQTFSFRLQDKTTGKLKLYVRFWDSQGAADIDYSKTWNDLYVAPAGPILQKGSISQYINHLKVNVSNTITGNMIKYELAKVSDGTVIKTGNLTAVTSFTVDITGLNPSTNYDSIYKIRAYANECWGNWLTLSDTNLKTKSLPTASLGSNNPILETDKQSININSNDDISSFQYELKTTDNTSIKSESSLTGTSKNISLSSTDIDTILQKYPNSQNAGCKIITKVISNGVTYTLNELSFNYLIPNTYKPTFDSSKIIEVSNIAYTDIMGTNTSKYIKGHNRLQGKIVPMVANGYSSGKNYLISCGNKQISLNYSESNQTFILDNIDSNTLNVIATDSRGFNNNGSKSLILVDYSNPTCNDIKIVRQGGVGTVAVLNANGKYTNWSGLALDNKIISVKYKYKISDGNYSNLIDITNKLTINVDGTWEIKDAVLDTTFEASNKYDIVLVFNDRLETITLSPYRLSTADVLLWRDLANKRLGINKKPDYSLDVNGDIKASGSLRIDGISYVNGIDLATPFINFHYNNDFNVDYTTKLVESSRGKLSQINENGNNINSYANSNDWNIDTSQDNFNFNKNCKVPSVEVGVGGVVSSGDVKTKGKNVVLASADGSTNHSGDILYTYGNGSKKSRIWMDDEVSSNNPRPNYESFDSSGNQVASGQLALLNDLFSANKILWGPDNYYMTGGQTINLSQKVSEQKNGIILVWQAYVNGEPQFYDFNYTFIPKHHTLVFPGRGVSCFLNNSTGAKIGTKYVYVHNDKIEGNNVNDDGETNRAGGITTINNYWVLTYVLGV